MATLIGDEPVPGTDAVRPARGGRLVATQTNYFILEVDAEVSPVLNKAAGRPEDDVNIASAADPRKLDHTLRSHQPLLSCGREPLRGGAAAGSA